MTTTAKQTVLADAEREIAWEVGDTKQEVFLPQFKTLHWDNASNFSLRLLADDYGGAEVRETEGVTEWEKDGTIARFYALEDEHGGFEIEVEFAERPESNVVAYTIRTKALEFFLQGPLDAEALARGDHRPEHVVGSYAAYSIADHGKAFHIYRPSARDAEGRTVWCDLHIDERAQLLTVTVPQDFLDAAVYPVVVDPTIGYSTIGGTSGGYANAQIEFHGPWTPASSGTLTDIQFYGSAVGPKVTYGVYADSAGTPGSLLYTSAEATISSSAAWNTATITGSITSGTPYWLAYRVNGSGTIQYDSGTPSGKFNTSSTYVSGVMPASPPSLSNFSNVKRSLYANYTTSGGTDYPVTASEYGSAADASSVVIGYARSASETGTASDSAASSTTQSGSVAESASVTDAVSGSAAGDFAGTLAESGSAVDAQSQVTAKSGALTESVTALDAASASFAATVTVVEAGSVADSSSSLASLGKSISEAGGAADAASGTTTGDYTGTVLELGIAADVASVVAALTASRSETMAAADTIEVVRAIAAVLADTLAPADAASASAAGDYTAAAAEALNALDTTSVQTAMTRTVAEVVTAADAQALLQQWVAAIAEVASAADLSGAALNAVVAQSLWWTYAVLAQDVRFAVPPEDITFEAAPASLAYRIER